MFLQILDATFDDVLPLAIKTMSPSLEGLVRSVIRDYFNLNVAEQLNRYVPECCFGMYDIFLHLLIFLNSRQCVATHVHVLLYVLFYRYNGPVLLVRRTEDEVVCTPADTLAGNRGNMLLTKLLLRRYPHLFSDTAESGALLTRFLSVEASDKGKFNITWTFFV